MRHTSISGLVFAFMLLMIGNVHAADFVGASGNPALLMAQNDFRADLKSKIEDRRSDASDASDVASQAKTSKIKNGNPSVITQQCSGEFALCLSSTCKPTGRKIKVKRDDGKTFRYFEESACKCPVITAEIAQQNGTTLTATASVNEGNMNGSCANRSPGTIWALYNSDITLYPQESFNPGFATAQENMHLCPAGTVGSNCWNFECKVDKEKTNGTKTATCFCAINDGQFGREVRPGDSLFTAAGGYFNPPAKACGMYPANGWLPPAP
jgi:hypothetical protein